MAATNDFPGDPPITSGNRTAEDHKDWIEDDLVPAIEDAMFGVAAISGRMTGVIRHADPTTGNAYGNLLVQQTTPVSMAVYVYPGIATKSGRIYWRRAAGNSSTLTAPVTNPRWDLVEIDVQARALNIVEGTEAASPSKPAASTYGVPIAYIYHRVGETSIKTTDDSTNGYIVMDRDWAYPDFSVGYCYDVDLTGLTNGQILVYNATSGDFEPDDPVVDASDLSDMDLTGISNGQGVTYNSSNGQLEPADVVTNTNRPMVLTAQGLTPASVGGCADPALTETASNDHAYWSADFDGASNEVGWFCNVALPVDFASGGTLTIRPLWTVASGSVGETVIWKVSARCFGDDDPLDAAFSSNIATVTDAVIAVGDLHIGPATSLTINGTVAANKLLTFRVERDATTDTHAADAKFIGLQVIYTASAT